MDNIFKTRQNRDMVFTRPSNLACAITPLVVMVIVWDLWGVKGGCDGGGFQHCLAMSNIRSCLKDEGGKEERANGVEEERDNDVKACDEAADKEASPPSLLPKREDRSHSDSSEYSSGDLSISDNEDEYTLPSLAEITLEIHLKILLFQHSLLEENIRQVVNQADMPMLAFLPMSETYESFLLGEFIHIDLAHIQELMSPPLKETLSSCTSSPMGGIWMKQALPSSSLLIRQDLIT